jgi:3-oxoacyl-[acyl-carrier-protein] synthase II
MTPRVVLTGIGTINPAMHGDSTMLASWLAALTPRAETAGVPRSPRDDQPVARRINDVVIDQQLDGGEARRLSRACRMSVIAARAARAEAGLEGGDALGLVVGTELGDLRSTIEFADGYLGSGPSGCSPLLFPNTVMNTMAAATTIAVAARALSLTLNAPTVAGELAVAYAAGAVAAGRVDAVLAGGVDDLAALPAEMLTALGDRARRGEGATYLVLESWAHARARGARPLAEIRGVGWRALAARPQGVGRVGSPAVAVALEGAASAPAEVAWLYTSANGDDLRDRWEAAVLAAAGIPTARPRASLTDVVGQHAGLGALRVAAAAWSTRAGRLAGDPLARRKDGEFGPGAPALVHGLARGGTHVALVVGPPPA